MGRRRNGGYAELVSVPAVNCLAYPDRLPWEQAAAVPLVFLTAWHMLVERAGVRPGESVLVHAAGSGVSSAATALTVYPVWQLAQVPIDWRALAPCVSRQAPSRCEAGVS